jgi:ATP phosphoribosyltransferase regulatory subunit HisZ
MGCVDVVRMQMVNTVTETDDKAVDLNIIQAKDGATQVSCLRSVLTVPIAVRCIVRLLCTSNGGHF